MPLAGIPPPGSGRVAGRGSRRTRRTRAEALEARARQLTEQRREEQNAASTTHTDVSAEPAPPAHAGRLFSPRVDVPPEPDQLHLARKTTPVRPQPSRRVGGGGYRETQEEMMAKKLASFEAWLDKFVVEQITLSLRLSLSQYLHLFLSRTLSHTHTGARRTRALAGARSGAIGIRRCASRPPRRCRCDAERAPLDDVDVTRRDGPRAEGALHLGDVSAESSAPRGP